MNILLIEDDLNECNKYKEIAKTRTDINIISITNSSTKAIEEMKKYRPDGIILDLELNNGEGSGFEFIQNMKKIKVNRMPKIVVTTNVHSDSVYDFCHINNIDFIFYKKQKNYSQNNIINTLVLLNEYNNENSGNKTYEKDEEKDYKSNIEEKIEKELDLVGISMHLQGRKYLKDAIMFIIKNNDDSKISIVQYLVKLHKKPSSSISRGMQNAIIHGWRVTPIQDLEKHYTAIINYETGLPTPTEFIYYYADKIKKQI